ncbi:MAG: peptide deformylase [Dehalococcoidia bacterium]|nr:peptide deformylase [Dehalococcoidia bacterium]
MAIKPILPMDDPVLRRMTKPVLRIDSSVRKLIADMEETIRDAGGVGLAAPQIGSSRRVAVLWMPDEEPFAIINPEIVKRIGEREVEEGCLSLPGWQARIKRAKSVTVKYFDIEGRPFRIRASDLLSQALEHEIEHLDGILYTDYIRPPNQLYRVEVKPERETPETGASPAARSEVKTA